MRILILIAALGLAAPASANEYALERARGLHTQLRDRAQCEAALPASREFWRSSEFATLAAEVRSSLLQEMMICAVNLRDVDGAIAMAQDARTLGARWADFSLFVLGVSFERDAITLEAFHASAQTDRARLARVPWRFAWGAIRAAHDIDPSGAEELRVHDVLESLPYAPEEGGSDDALRVAHAQLLLTAGQNERARERLSTVTAARQVMIMRVDRRFDPLRQDAAFAGRLDLRAAAEADLVRARSIAEAQPTNLHNFLEVAQSLRSLGRSEEALDLLDLHIARARAPGGGGYEDTDDTLNWLLNERAYILYELNRPDEAREAFGLAMATREQGGWNTSQVINFASMLVGEGRARDALEVIQTVGEASPFGDMWIANVRACAAAQLGDATLQDASMAFLREHADDNIAALTHASLCVNDVDGAAALYIRRLADPEHRSGALLALQRYRLPPGSSLPFNIVLLERLEQVRARPDVQAAIEAVGRIEDVPLQNVYWGDV